MSDSAPKPVMRLFDQEILPPHPLLFLGDESGETPPVSNQRAVESNQTCLVILTQASVDGPVRVVITEQASPLASQLVPVFEGELETRAGSFSLRGAEGEILWRRENTSSQKVRVSTDGSLAPSLLLLELL